jgi:hypothetical protein
MPTIAAETFILDELTAASTAPGWAPSVLS